MHRLISVTVLIFFTALTAASADKQHKQWSDIQSYKGAETSAENNNARQLAPAARKSNPREIRKKCFTSHMRSGDTPRCMAMLRGSRANTVQWAPGATSRNVKIKRATARGRGHGTLVVIKPIDKASPLLRRAARTGKPLPQIVLRARDRQGKYYTIKLERCFIKSWSTSGDADDRPTEEVAFYYNRIAD